MNGPEGAPTSATMIRPVLFLAYNVLTSVAMRQFRIIKFKTRKAQAYDIQSVERKGSTHPASGLPQKHDLDLITSINAQFLMLTHSLALHAAEYTNRGGAVEFIRCGATGACTIYRSHL